MKQLSLTYLGIYLLLLPKYTLLQSCVQVYPGPFEIEESPDGLAEHSPVTTRRRQGFWKSGLSCIAFLTIGSILIWHMLHFLHQSMPARKKDRSLNYRLYPSLHNTLNASLAERIDIAHTILADASSKYAKKVPLQYELHHFVMWGNVNQVRFLVKKYAHQHTKKELVSWINQQDGNGCTPLDYAISHNYHKDAQLVQFLQAYGAQASAC